jgi:hypothetical protein
MLIGSAALSLSAGKLHAWSQGGSPLRVCLLVEPNLPRQGAPANLATLLAGAPGVSILTCDAAAIARQGIDADIFCNSHGSVYPAAIGGKVYEFLARGGSLLHIGGVPFDRAVTQKDGKWVPDEKAAQELREKLGIHRYVPAFPLEGAPGLRQAFDPLLVNLAPGFDNLPQASVNITTTMPLHVANPAQFGVYSVTYLAKPVCRHTHIAARLEDPSGEPILSSLLLTKTWRNPYDALHAEPCGPWAILTADFEGPVPSEMFARLWAWLTCPAFLGPVELELATLRPGEQTTVTAPLHGNLPLGWEVSAHVAILTLEEWKRGKSPAWTRAQAKAEAARVGVQIRDEGRPEAFLFGVRFQLTDESGHARDYSESAVVAWRPEAVRSGPSLHRNRSYLDYSMAGRERPASFQIGTNWQDSEVYGLTWHNPNPLRVAADARSMAEAGLRVMRVHYVMPEFLRVLAADVFRTTHADFYHSFEAGPELTERHLRALEAHAMVFGRLGMMMMPSVYTCVGPSMGNCQSWLFTSERYEMPDMIEAQKVFGRQVMDRLGSLPCISWDLVNEPDVALPTVGHWLDGMRPIWGRTGQLLGIGTSGLEQNLSLGESADWHSVHANCSHGIASQIFRTGKPHFYHEAWVHSESTKPGEAEDEQTLGQTIARTVVRGACGFMPWNWQKLLAYWRYGASETEVGDLTLGACAQGEGVRRRGWFALRNWATLMDGVSFDQTLAAQVVHIYPRLTLTGDRPQLWLEALRAQNLACVGIDDREFADADLSGTRLVVVPHFGMGYRQSTYRNLMAYAAQGGVVWAHADSMRRDEDGKLDPTRAVQFTNARIAAGRGALEWYFGWSLPTRWEPGTSSQRFEQLIRGMNWVRPAASVIPLVNGELRFQGDKDLESIRTVQIVDAARTVTRGWSGDGSPLAWPGISISSPGQLFVMRMDANTFRVSGEAIRVASSLPVSARLPEYPGYELAKRLDRGATVIEPHGWQRGCWFELRLG